MQALAGTSAMAPAGARDPASLASAGPGPALVAALATGGPLDMLTSARLDVWPARGVAWRPDPYSPASPRVPTRGYLGRHRRPCGLVRTLTAARAAIWRGLERLADSLDPAQLPA